MTNPATQENTNPAASAPDGEAPKPSLGSLAFSVWMPVTAVVMTIFGFPLMATKSGARLFARNWGRVILFGLKVFCGLDYRVEGREHMPMGPALIAAKHQSTWETIGLLVCLPNPIFILKKELLAVPVFGWWAARAGFIGIDRNDGARALKTMIQKARDVIAEGQQIIIFPEGSRIPVGERTDYQPGVYALYRALDVPCVPVAHNAGQFWLNGSLQRETGVISVKFLPALQGKMARQDFLGRLQREIDGTSERLAGLDAERETGA
jgi:1-acyl-sn-glycerol-3-phosphate acyltransferase